MPYRCGIRRTRQTSAKVQRREVILRWVEWYAWWWWWCWVILPILEKYNKPILPDPQFYSKLRELTPQLYKLLAPSLDQAVVKMRKGLTPKIEAVVRAAFKAR